MFKPPRVQLYFASGVTQSLFKRITKRGAVVIGDVVSLDSDQETDDDSESDSSSDNDSNVDDIITNDVSDIDMSKINLDITAMIAYVSALTNGRCHFSYTEKILTEQAEWERERPVKPFLDSVFKDKQLVCCSSAMRDFETITNTLGGSGEKERASQLIQRIIVVPDSDSPRSQSLKVSGKIKERSRSIFGTGDNLKILTVTANTGFLRAARGQGVNFAVVTHESRALTEEKEKFAISCEG